MWELSLSARVFDTCFSLPSHGLRNVQDGLKQRHTSLLERFHWPLTVTNRAEARAGPVLRTGVHTMG
jgi:hypothetical protein